MGGLLWAIAHWAVKIVYSFGYVGLAFLITLSNLSLPVPSQLVLPLAGFLVGEGRFSFSLALLSATSGTVVSALLLYSLGSFIGEEPLRRFVRWRYTLLRESDLDKAGKAFERHGGKIVLLGHLFPAVGTLISVPAGVEKMSLTRFILYTTLGGVIWNGTFIGLGWALGARWRIVGRYAPILEHIVLSIAAAATLWLLWSRWTARKK